MLPLDMVYCCRCLVWPSQAADWPARQRNYGWPDSATVEHVVGNGYDTVQVAHRRCRQDELMSKLQCRLSFSRAEIVLINSWMPEQQIVYHMLRLFVKTERLTDSVDNSKAATLSNYHIKTLMLWACELKPRSWWTGSLNLVQICVKLLHTFFVWLTERRCKHYFINGCNLLDDNMMNMQMIVTKLMSTNEARLSSWFVKNYIDKCAERCPFVVSGIKLQDVVSAVVDWRLASSIADLYHTCCYAEFLIQLTVSISFRTLRSCVCLKNMFAKTDARLTVYFTAVAFLGVARRISSKGFSDKLMDILTELLGYDVDIPRYRMSSVFFLNTGTKLMKAVAHKFVSTMQRAEIHLWKAYLQRALRCKDSDSDSIYCLANVYLAVLYYTTGQYQTAIDHCTRVMRSQDHSQCSSSVVQGELLPKIDDNIDSALGLAVFYQYVLSVAFNHQQQRQYCSVFTTELFAYHLNIKLMSVTKCPVITGIFQRYLKCMYEMRQFFCR